MDGSAQGLCSSMTPNTMWWWWWWSYNCRLCVRLLQFKSDWRCRSPRRWLTLFNPLVSASSLKPRELGTAYSIVPCSVIEINIYNWLRFAVMFAVSRTSTARCWTSCFYNIMFESDEPDLKMHVENWGFPPLKREPQNVLISQTAEITSFILINCHGHFQCIHTEVTERYSQPIVYKWARFDKGRPKFGSSLSLKYGPKIAYFRVVLRRYRDSSAHIFGQKVKVYRLKVNVDLYNALSEHTSKVLRYGTRFQGISQFYLHTPRSSCTPHVGSQTAEIPWLFPTLGSMGRSQLLRVAAMSSINSSYLWR